MTPADPFDMGAGHIDPSGNWGKKDSIIRPGLVYDAGLFEYAAYTCGANLNIFTPGSCTFLAAIGIPLDASDLNVPSIGVSAVVGSRTVVRTVTRVDDLKSKKSKKSKEEQKRHEELQGQEKSASGLRHGRLAKKTQARRG